MVCRVFVWQVTAKRKKVERKTREKNSGNNNKKAKGNHDNYFEQFKSKDGGVDGGATYAKLKKQEERKAAFKRGSEAASKAAANKMDEDSDESYNSAASSNSNDSRKGKKGRGQKGGKGGKGRDEVSRPVRSQRQRVTESKKSVYQEVSSDEDDDSSSSAASSDGAQEVGEEEEGDR